MHFRIRGNSAQIVKAVQDAATGKSVSKPIGSVNMLSGTLSGSAREAMSEEDVAFVQAWLARKQDADKRRRQLDAELLPSTLGGVVQWTREATVDEVRAIADDLLFSLRDLQAAIGMKLREGA